MYLKDRAKFLHIEKKLATGELKVAEKDGEKKSNVWKHFDIVVKAEPGYFQHEPYVRCRACGIIMNYHSKKTGTSQMQRHSSRRCMRGFIGRPKDDANHPDFAPSQNLAHQAGLTCPVSSYEEGEDEKGSVKIKVEEDYEQLEEPLSGQDDPTEDQRRDDGRSPTSFTTNKLKEIGEQNRSSEITKESYSRHQTCFDADHAQTLGEILAYCQVMYGAIQKLDEKLESLQAKVVHIEPVQLTTELFQKATSNAAQLLANNSMDLPIVNAVNESPVPNLPTVSMPELVRVCSPSPLSAAVKARKPPHLLPATRDSSPVRLPDQGTAASSSSSSSVAATHSPHVKPIEGEEDTEVQPSEHSPPRRGSTKIVPSIMKQTGSERLGWVGDRKRNVCLSQGKMLKVQKMTKPSRAVRFLFRSLFSVEELQCSNTLGDQARGLKRLDPNKIAAIRVRRKMAEKNMPGVADLEELSTLSESTDEEEEIEDNPPEYEAPAAATTACAAVEKFLMEQVGELHLKMDHIIELLQSRHPGARDTDTILPMLPLATMDDLHDFDWRLQSDSTFRTQVINKLSLSGGKNIRETVWRVCSKAISQNLATQLNWCGRGQKTGLKSTPIHQVLLSAVLANPVGNYTEAEVETAMKNWLRLSGDRDGGRQRRRTYAACTPETTYTTQVVKVAEEV
ncbi:uncharacterized protein zgc:113423 isoform X2 [Engraulis encrasicolus]|uniref:uncharacterized protein zgc:113423 isoform X2 n=1 Tax=Engraulis encrasicolus TaxID=184585 RepID=UPI002FD7165C